MKEKISYRLKGHEKFYLREGWLNKGLLSVKDNPRVFFGNDGPDILGVGNNMVRSIKYWMLAFGLLEENSKKGAFLTTLANVIIENDPFFEDNFTLWLLHSNISKNISKATSWYMFFNRFSLEEFTKGDILTVLKTEIFDYTENPNIPENSIKDDIDVLVNMYTNKKTNSDDPEDKNISPFATLGLFKRSGEKIARKQPDLRIINEWIILYELSEKFLNEKNISIDLISTGENSLGNIYNLNRVTINEYLDRLDTLGYIKVDRTAGLDVIYLLKKILPEEAIIEYYKQRK